jgi:hypothetical protein
VCIIDLLSLWICVQDDTFHLDQEPCLFQTCAELARRRITKKNTKNFFTLNKCKCDCDTREGCSDRVIRSTSFHMKTVFDSPEYRCVVSGCRTELKSTMADLMDHSIVYQRVTFFFLQTFVTITGMNFKCSWVACQNQAF